jgi:hypothetical protein
MESGDSLPMRRGQAGLVSLLIATIGCGGSDPAIPTPVVTPSPTPTPSVSFTLDASADHFRYSVPLGRLSPGISFDAAFRPLDINHAETEDFAHAVSFWLYRTDGPPAASDEDGVAFAFTWVRDSRWEIRLRTPPGGYADTGRRAEIPMGNQQTLRLTRLADGSVQFWVDGTIAATLPASPDQKFVFTQVVGARAEFIYTPIFPTAPARSASTPSGQRSGAVSCREAEMAGNSSCVD